MSSDSHPVVHLGVRADGALSITLDGSLPDAVDRLKSQVAAFPFGPGLHGRVSADRVRVWLRGSGGSSGWSQGAWLFEGQFTVQNQQLRLSGVLRVDLWFRFLLACSVAGAAFSLYLLLGALFHFRGWRAAKDPAIFVVLLTAMAMLLRWSTKPGSPDQSLLVHALYEALAVEPSVTEETSA